MAGLTGTLKITAALEGVDKVINGLKEMSKAMETIRSSSQELARSMPVGTIREMSQQTRDANREYNAYIGTLTRGVSTLGRYYRVADRMVGVGDEQARSVEVTARRMQTMHTGLRTLTMNLSSGVRAVDYWGYALDKAAMSMWKFMIAAIPLERLSYVMLGIAGALSGLVVWSARGAGQFESLKAQFTGLMRSSDLAEDRLQKLYKFAAETPFNVDQVTRAGVVIYKIAQQTGQSYDTVLRAAATLAAGTSGMGHDIARADRKSVV